MMVALSGGTSSMMMSSAGRPAFLVLLCAVVVASAPSLLGAHWGLMEVLGFFVQTFKSHKQAEDIDLLSACLKEKAKLGSKEWDVRKFAIEGRFNLKEVFSNRSETAIEELSVLKRRYLHDSDIDHSIVSSKIKLYKFLSTTRVPSQPVIWCSFKGELYQSPEIESRMLRESCDKLRNSDSPVVVKAAHCLNSAGMAMFATTASCDRLQDHITRYVNMIPYDVAPHMYNVPPGALLQKYFHDRDMSILQRFAKRYYFKNEFPPPPELKVEVMWGRAMFAQARNIGTRYIFRDGSASGLLKNMGVFDWVGDISIKKIFRVAEAFAQAVGMPNIRVDFFISRDGSWALNEVEAVSGTALNAEWPLDIQRCFGDIWSRPYSNPDMNIMNRTNDQIHDDMRKALDEVMDLVS